MTYEQWEGQVPGELREDTVWKMEAYRLGLFLSDLAWHDAAKLLKKRLTFHMADQLMRATSNISPNITEGYSRGKDRARFYEYALGSARESRDWYYKSRRVLEKPVVVHCLDLCTQMVRLLLKTVARERRSNIRIGATR
jgi:four helix bundle protein